MKIQILILSALVALSTQMNQITPIWKNNLLTTIPEWGKEYAVSFDINPVSIQKPWANIVQFSTGKDCCAHGNRIPGVWFAPNSLKLMISSAVNGEGNFHRYSPPLKPGKWSHVYIHQTLNKKGQYVYTIRVNNKVLVSIVNKRPTLYKNVKVYAGSPWYVAADAVLRNFRFTVEPEFKGNVKRGKLLTTIKSWGKAWRVSFKIRPLGKRKPWSNIIHLTKGGDSGKPGTRIPGVWLYPNSMRLTVFTNKDASAAYHTYTTPKDLPMTRYTKVRIQQLMNVHGQYVYQVIIDGKVVQTKIQKNPKNYPNVKLYASDPWYVHADVYIRDLHLEGVASQHFYKTV